MSKAFLPEDSAVPEGPLLPPRKDEPAPITAAGLARLRAERAALDERDEAHRTRAAMLDRILATVTVVEASLVDGGAGFGCEVETEDVRGARKVYTLVGPDEVEPSAGRITVESPLGARLVGVRVGDEVELPRGDVLEVIAVRVPR